MSVPEDKNGRAAIPLVPDGKPWGGGGMAVLFFGGGTDCQYIL